MPVYGSIIIIGSNSLIGFLGLAENEAPISDHTNNTLFHQIILFLAIVIPLGWLCNYLAKDSETNLNANEDHPIEELLDHFFESHLGSDELYHNFDGGDHQRATAVGEDSGGRHGGCDFCGGFSNTRCSRCKTARYCSNICQVRHWISGHKYECSESEPSADDARPTHDHGPPKLLQKSEMKSTSNNVSRGDDGDDGVKKRSESDMAVDESSGNGVNFHGCEVCNSPSTTRCSRCKAVNYCSVKCLIMDWGWHKEHCITREVHSAQTERPHRDVRLLRNSNEEEENVHSSEGIVSFKPPMEEVSQDSTNNVLYLEDEVPKSRNEMILLLQSELEEWKNRANFAKEKFQSLVEESNNQLLVLKNEKESISNAKEKAFNVIHSLHEEIFNLQNAVKESIVEKRKQEEHIQCLEHECAKLKKELQEEHKRSQCLTIESTKSRETARIAMREVELVRQELQEEREHARRLEENFRRDVIIAESRAVIAEAKFSDLYRKIRTSDHKICSICLSSEKDLAFGCGHMTCRDCGSKLSKCPICREKITNHIKLFPG